MDFTLDGTFEDYEGSLATQYSTDDAFGTALMSNASNADVSSTYLNAYDSYVTQSVQPTFQVVWGDGFDDSVEAIRSLGLDVQSTILDDVSKGAAAEFASALNVAATSGASVDEAIGQTFSNFSIALNSSAIAKVVGNADVPLMIYQASQEIQKAEAEGVDPNSANWAAMKAYVVDAAGMIGWADAAGVMTTLVEGGAVFGAAVTAPAWAVPVGAALVGFAAAYTVESLWDTIKANSDYLESLGENAATVASNVASELSSDALSFLNYTGSQAEAVINAMASQYSQLMNDLGPAGINDLIAVGHWMASAVEPLWGTAQTTGSPLVLDLSSTGSGITLANVNGSGAVYWDYGDGFKHQSGWVTGTTGFLCIDPTGTGHITQADLFGNNGTYANGFAALQAFAGVTGVLDASNPVFSELRVWVPSAASGGVSQPGDLYTLAQLGITSINLSYSNANYQISGNNIEEQSTFVINGNTQTIADAWFATDPVNTIYDGSYTFNPEVMALPDQRGYGQLPELSISMCMDSTLLSDVQGLASQSLSQLVNPSYSLESVLKGILYEWAGVENVDPTSRGPYVNAQELDFLQQLMGQPFQGDWSGTEDIPNATPYIVQAWNDAFSFIAAHLLAQSGFATLMGNPVYDLSTDTLLVNGTTKDFAVQFADEVSNDGALHHLAANDIFVLQPGDAPLNGANQPGLLISETANSGGINTVVLAGATEANTIMWTDNHGDLFVKYSSTDVVEIMDGQSSTAPSIVSEYIQQIAFPDGGIWNLEPGLHLTANSLAATIYGSAGGNDVLDTGGVNDATIYNGTGNDTDVFTSGSPAATIYANASGGSDNVLQLHGVTAGQVALSDNTGGQLIVTDTAGDQIIIANGSFNWTSGFTAPNMDHIALDDGSTIALSGSGLDLTATSNYELLYGASGFTMTADAYGVTIYAFTGNETLVGGNGASLWNGSGNDTDVFSSGFGSANLYANANGGNDNVLQIHNVTADHVAIADNSGGSLLVTDSAGDLITINGGSFDWTNGFVAPNMDHIALDGGSTIALSGSGLDLTATSYGQVLYGGSGYTMTADANSVTIYAVAGNETLVGANASSLWNGSGNDTDVFSSGFGSANIYADASGGSSNAIVLHSVTASQLFLTDTTNGNLIISDTAGDQITVNGGSYSSSSGFTIGNVQQIDLDGGTHISLTGGLNLTATGNSQGLYGTGNGDHLTAQGSGDYLYGIAGNNTITGAANATTYEYGGSGNDTFVDGGGTANNLITAGTGADQYVIESPNSSTTISGFSVAKGDLINVENVISGYDPVADALGNFVQETTVGNSTQISLDPTGQGHFSAVSVTLSGVTGLDDVATLVANHTLIVHS